MGLSPCLLPSGQDLATVHVQGLAGDLARFLRCQEHRRIGDLLRAGDAAEREGRGEPNASAIRAGLRNIHYHLDYIGWLCDRRRWLAGDGLSLADIAR